MKVSVEFIKECFSLDDSTGKVMWKTRPPHHFPSDTYMKMCNTKYAGKIAGNIMPKGYQVVGFPGYERIYGQTISWVLAYGKYPDLPVIDHKDGNPQNNRIGNLRECTVAQNHQNARRKLGVCGLKGVHPRKRGTFRAQINVDGRRIYLGEYQTAEEGHQAYCAAALKYHGEFANFEPKRIAPTSLEQTTGETQ